MSRPKDKSKSWLVNHALSRVFLIAVLLSSVCSQTALQTDYDYCKTSFANRSTFVATNYTDPDNNPTYTLTQASNVIKYFLKFDFADYVSANLVSLIPWLLLVSVSILGFLCCSSILLVNIIRKDRYVLTPMEKKKLDKDNQKAKKSQEKAKRKEELKKAKEGKENDEEEESGEEEEDEEDNFEDVDDDPVKLIELSKTKNHPDFRRTLS